MKKIFSQSLSLCLFMLLTHAYVVKGQQIEPGVEADLDNPGLPMKSGLYQGVNLSEGQLPDNSHVWMHLLNARHANLSNNHQLQIAGSYTINDRLFFRKIAAGNVSHNSTWIELATRNENIFQGNQYFPGKGIWNAVGKVGIGTTNVNGDYNLFVTKGIRTEKVQVDIAGPNGWADYVFETTYKLPTLKQIEQFIQANKHLPEVPSAVEVEKDGIDLGKMNAILLKKIEELTLYLIEQNIKLEYQNNEIQSLKAKMKDR